MNLFVVQPGGQTPRTAHEACVIKPPLIAAMWVPLYLAEDVSSELESVYVLLLLPGADNPAELLQNKTHKATFSLHGGKPKVTWPAVSIHRVLQCSLYGCKTP